MKKTVTKAELIALLKHYPDDAKIVLTLMKSDLARGETIRELGLPGDSSYDPADHVISLCVWDDNVISLCTA
ncbi:hypothetical protein ACM3N2_17790 [Aeromonas hydrophila]|uniref:hypothetical protein n=1 Tax=Aeromonas hydrophila TaxID=644 RepID=UPI0039F65F4F